MHELIIVNKNGCKFTDFVKEEQRGKKNLALWAQKHHPSYLSSESHRDGEEKSLVQRIVLVGFTKQTVIIYIYDVKEINLSCEDNIYVDVRDCESMMLMIYYNSNFFGRWSWRNIL